MNGLRRWVSFVLFCLVAVVGISVVAAGAASASSLSVADTEVAESSAQPITFDAHVSECAETPPSDHSEPEGGTSETIGYVDGFWYNQPLDLDSETLTEEELRDLTLRTAARVEALRCLAFQEVPPIEMVSRDDFSDRVAGFYDEEFNESDRLFANARLATLLVAGQDRDAVDVMAENRAAFPSAFYDLEDEYMGFVTDDPDSIEIDQTTLAHELVHALGDQHLDLEQTFDQPTNDEFIASLAVVEGDAVLFDGMYADNCDAEAWVDECIRPEVDPAEPPNWGLTLNQLAAYNSKLVAYTYENEGVAGVNALYEDMPQSTVEVLYPEQYGEFERAEITVEDLSSGDWERIEFEGVDYDILGQHALTAILMAPLYEAGEMVIDLNEFLQEHSGGFVDYGHSATDGWLGDKFYGYANGDQTGAVWKFAWETSEDAEEFTRAYETLVTTDIRGGEQSDSYSNVYTFDGSDEYDMALGIERDNDELLIVMAPTVDELTAVHSDFTLDDGDTTDTDQTDDADDVDVDHVDDEDADDPDASDEVDPADDADDDGAGFGVLVGLVAVVASLLALRSVETA